MELGLKIIILTFAAGAITVAAILWLNPDAPTSTTQIATLVGALALALTAITPIFKQERKQSFYTLTLFRDNALGGYMLGPAYHPYWESIGHLFGGLPSTSSAFGPAVLMEKEQIPDFLQFAILRQIAMNTAGSWDGEVVHLAKVYDGNSQRKIVLGTDSPSKTLSSEAMRRSLAHNQFAQLLEDGSIQVPEGTTLTSIEKGDDRVIVLDANGFKITMGVAGWSGGTLNTPLWGIIDPPVDDPMRYEVQQYTIVVMAETPKFRRYLSGIDSYWKWYENIKGTFVDIDWPTIDAAMIDQSRRGDYPDVLGQIIKRHQPSK